MCDRSVADPVTGRYVGHATASRRIRSRGFSLSSIAAVSANVVETAPSEKRETLLTRRLWTNLGPERNRLRLFTFTGASTDRRRREALKRLAT